MGIHLRRLDFHALGSAHACRFDDSVVHWGSVLGFVLQKIDVDRSAEQSFQDNEGALLRGDDVPFFARRTVDACGSAC